MSACQTILKRKKISVCYHSLSVKSQQLIIRIVLVDLSERSEDMRGQSKSPASVVDSTTSPSSANLPFPIQHRLLVKLQAILEEACFTFACHKLPDVLEKNGWKCAEQVQLNQWTEVFLAHQHIFATDKVYIGTSLSELFISMTELRHTVVRRVQTRATKIQLFICEAEKFLGLFQNEKYALVIAQLQRKMNPIIKELQKKKILLHNHLQDTLEEIRIARAKLDSQECAAMAFMLEEDAQCQSLAELKLEQVIAESEMLAQPQVEQEHGSTSNLLIDSTKPEQPCAKLSVSNQIE